MRRGIALVWLGHPVTVVALVVLVVNDHVLKAAYPGWVTGKLSDAAGMVLAPPLLATLVELVAPRWRCRWGAIVAVGAAFGLVKTIPYVAQVASAVWSAVTPSLVRADPTDLVALPFLGVAWWCAGRAERACTERRVRVLRVAVLLPLALAGVAATSALDPPTADEVLVANGGIYLQAGSQYRGAWSVSRDAGRTWTGVPHGVSVRSAGEACSPAEPAVCYRVVPRALAVERRDAAGVWRTSWAIDATTRRALYRAYGDMDDIDRHLSSTSLAVLDTAGGHVVVVANGRDGFALRDVGGAWHRIGFPGMPEFEVGAPYDLDEAGHVVLPSSRWFGLAVTILLFGLTLGVLGALSVLRAGGSPFWWCAPFVLLLAGLPLVGVTWLAQWEPASLVAAPAYFTPGLVVILALACAVPVLIAAAVSVARRARWLGWAAGTLVLAAAGQVAAFQVWVRAGSSRTGILVGCALAACALSAAGVVGAARSSAGERPRPSP